MVKTEKLKAVQQAKIFEINKQTIIYSKESNTFNIKIDKLGCKPPMTTGGL